MGPSAGPRAVKCRPDPQPDAARRGTLPVTTDLDRFSCQDMAIADVLDEKHLLFHQRHRNWATPRRLAVTCSDFCYHSAVSWVQLIEGRAEVIDYVYVLVGLK